MLLAVFTIATLCRISIGLLCGCSGHHHNEVKSICSVEHSHHSQEDCHKEPKAGHCCGIHYENNLEYELSILNKRYISPSVVAILYNNYDSKEQVATSETEPCYYYHSTSSQWSRFSLRQRPPPSESVA